jgi:hypothetical protein
MAKYIYKEEVSSNKTNLLFLFLMFFFIFLLFVRVSTVGFRGWSIFWFVLTLFFFFYGLNYRTLRIFISEDALHLRFGLVRWKTSLENIQSIQMDDSPFWIKYGGAGVHFAYVNKRYRAFYNFLEFPRVLITFHQKQGPVQELTFTTQAPEKIIQLIQAEIIE